MKSQEEIEHLAKQLCNIPIDLVIDEEERYYKNFQKYDGIIQGYTQCQKDLNKDLYLEIENLIIKWCNDGTKTVETLTKQIMELLNK